jgi:DNA polymerase III delta subunit
MLFDKDNLTPDSFADAVNTPAFMCEWKVIEISGIPSGQQLPRYVEILGSLPQGVAVLFVCRAGDFDTNLAVKAGGSGNELVDLILREGVYVNFMPENGSKLTQWIRKHFQSRGVAVADGAVSFLPEYCGNDMYILSGEIDKLCSIYNGSPITAKDVAEICCANAEYRIYDIVNCLSEGNTVKLKKVYDGLVYTKTKPELILGAVAGYFADLQNFRTAFSENRPSEEVKKRLGYADFQASRLSATARKVNEDFIKNGLEECRNTDIIVKTHSSDPYTAIELMLYRIISHGKKQTKS